MRELRDGVVIAAPPERVWSWLARLADNYRDWHAAHISAEWVKGEPNTVGAVLQAIEHLGGRREVLRFELTSVDPPRRLDSLPWGQTMTRPPRARPIRAPRPRPQRRFSAGAPASRLRPVAAGI